MQTDVLVLGIARVRQRYSVVGMTTQPDPITGLRWIRLLKQGLPLTRDDLHYEDGQPIRMGDVIQLETIEPQPTPPFVENVIVDWSSGPPAFIRELTEQRRAAFFPRHIDPDPKAVLSRTPSRSVCLLKPDTIEAVFTFDAETERFEARVFPRFGRLKSDDGVPVFDPYWQAWGMQQMGDEEYLELTAEQIAATLGDIYLTIGLNARQRAQVLGVHSVPGYSVSIDEHTL